MFVRFIFVPHPALIALAFFLTNAIIIVPVILTISQTSKTVYLELIIPSRSQLVIQPQLPTPQLQPHVGNMRIFQGYSIQV